MSIICTVCGAENMEGSIYCEDCGARLPAGAAATATAPPPPPAPAAPPPATPPPAPTPAPPPAPTPGATPASAAGGTVECEACGAVNPAGEAYCEDCGAALPGSAAAEGPSVTIPDTPPVVDTPTAPPVTSLDPAETVASPPTAGPSTRAKLLLADGGQEFPLDKDTINIGRRSPVDGIFPEVDLTEADKDSYISRRHAKIEFREGGEILFEDLGSSNGSFLNGNRLQSGIQATIKDGDRLRLGKTELVFKNG